MPYVGSRKQEERQEPRFRNRGKYAKVNPCNVCGKSSGVDYLAHRDTDNGIDDELIMICERCYQATFYMTGKEAVEWARKNYPDTFQF